MVCSSLIASSIGGSGCIVSPHSPTLLKAYLGKVRCISDLSEPEADFITAVGHQDINCSSTELVSLDPPSGQICGAYLQNYIASAGGYVTNPDDTSSCMYCSSRTTDQFLGLSFNIFYSHHWRNFGILLGVTCFNVS